MSFYKKAGARPDPKIAARDIVDTTRAGSQPTEEFVLQRSRPKLSGRGPLTPDNSFARSGGNWMIDATRAEVRAVQRTVSTVAVKT
jgi:hypothetical protein